MSRIRKALGQTGERGASAVEYALMVAAIAAVIVLVVFGLGLLVTTTFQGTCASIESRNPITVQDSEDC
jgi:pilus assembly protein Flp/PilA